jgi:hypothetical protein
VCSSDLFEDPRNKLSSYAKQHENIARYWLQHGKHDNAFTSPIIACGQKIWDMFIEKIIYWESKAGEHTVRRWLC